MRKAVVTLYLGIVLLIGTIAGAKEQNEITDIKKVVEKQDRQIEQLMDRIDTLEAKLDKQAEHTASWWWRIKLHGDLRYRHELIKIEGKEDRNRQRVRARVGLDAEVTETVHVGFQIATGSDDPVSTNQTLDGGFSSKDVWIDLAYFKWHPENIPGLHVISGKMKNPFYRPGKTELIWDGDLRPEGAAAKYAETLDNWVFFTNLGGFWVEERSTEADTGLFGVQVGMKYTFPFLGDKGHILIGGSYYDYGNTKGKPSIYDSDAFGNSVDAEGDYLFDYDLVESFIELGFKFHGIPISLFSNYVMNTASGVRNDKGWLAGLAVGKCKAPNSGAFRYNYRDLEADAVLGAFADSDFIGGGTDGRGHEIGFDYQMAEHVKAGVSYFYSKRGISSGGRDYQRLQLDFVFKF